MKTEEDKNPLVPLWVLLTFGAVFTIALLSTLAWYFLVYRPDQLPPP
jgi:hypothetical protein